MRSFVWSGAAVALAMMPLGCGYRPAAEVRDPVGPFAVAGGRTFVPSSAAIAAAEAGAREELALGGQLARCAPRTEAESCSVLVIEILRIDEASAGIAVEMGPPIPAGVPGGDAVSRQPLPLARGIRVTIVGRAFVRPAAMHAAGPPGAAERETGDFSTSELVARTADPAAMALAREDAVRIAARRLGRRLAGATLGKPEPSAE